MAALQRICLNLKNSITATLPLNSALTESSILTREFHSSLPMSYIQKQTRLNCVDDSEIGRLAKISGKIPKVIGIHGEHTRRGNYRYAGLGDKVTVAVNGEVKWGYVVGCKIEQRPLVPKFDSNNVVLIEKNGTPIGKRVLVPIPSSLRKKADGHFSKILAISSKFC